MIKLHAKSHCNIDVTTIDYFQKLSLTAKNYVIRRVLKIFQNVVDIPKEDGLWIRFNY